MKFGDPWTKDQQALVDVVMRVWMDTDHWPKFEYVAAKLDDHGPDAVKVLRSFPVLGERGMMSRSYCDVTFDHIHPSPPEDSEVGLSVAGFYRHPLGTQIADAFAAVLRLTAQYRRQATIDPTRVAQLILTSKQAEAELPRWPAPILRSVGALLRSESILGLQGWSSNPEGSEWTVTVGREVTRYADITADSYLDLIRADIESTAAANRRLRRSVVDPQYLVDVNLGRGWNQTDSVIRQLINLDWLRDAGSVGSHISLQPMFTGNEATAEETLISDLQQWEQLGWVELSLTYDIPDSDCALTAAGAGFIDDIRQRRGDIAGRRKSARDAVLYWLYEAVATGTSPANLADFWTTRYAIYYGQHFASAEVDQASRWLKEKGYLRGQGAMGGGILRPAITADGETMVESGGSVNDQPAARVAAEGPQITVTGSGNVVMANSPNAQQTATITITEDHRRQTMQFADLLEQSLPALNLPATANSVPAELRRAAEQNDPGVLHRAVLAAQGAVAGAATTALGDLVLNQLHSLMGTLGLGG